MRERFQSLAHINQACWHELQQASLRHGHGWRHLALATTGLPSDAGTGLVAELRSVVLREVIVDERLIVFYTDSRSPKVAQLQAQPLGTLMCWCPVLSWQLRLRVRLSLDTDGLGVSSRWARLKLRPAAQDYLSPLPPGTPLDEASCVPPSGPDRESRPNFGVVFAKVEHSDWLELHAEGHRRAAFDAQGQGQWLTP